MEDRQKDDERTKLCDLYFSSYFFAGENNFKADEWVFVERKRERNVTVAYK